MSDRLDALIIKMLNPIENGDIVRAAQYLHEFKRLIEIILDDDLSEPVADSGETVLDAWKVDARKLLGRK